MEYQNTATKVILRSEALADLGREVSALGCTRVMVVCGGRTLRSQIFSQAIAALGPLAVVQFQDVVEHPSTSAVTRGAELARAHQIDGCVAIGGGSAADTAKGIVLLLAEEGSIEEHASRFVAPDQFFPTVLARPKIPVISVPTTASAAEVTPGLGLRDETGRKLLFWDVKLASRLIVLDPNANVGVPVGIMASTAMNGLAHCAEGLYSRLRSPISDGLALQGIKLFAQHLPEMSAQPDNIDARAGVLMAAHLSGMVVSNARVGIHHAVCHCLGARGALAHGVANSIMLPHALAYNLEVAAPALALLGRAMGCSEAGTVQVQAERAIDAVKALQLALGVPTRLRDTGLDKSLLPAIAQDTLGDRGLYFNPRRTESVEPVLQLLHSAW